METLTEALQKLKETELTQIIYHPSKTLEKEKLDQLVDLLVEALPEKALFPATRSMIKGRFNNNKEYIEKWLKRNKKQLIKLIQEI